MRLKIDEKLLTRGMQELMKYQINLVREAWSADNYELQLEREREYQFLESKAKEMGINITELSEQFNGARGHIRLTQNQH